MQDGDKAGVIRIKEVRGDNWLVLMSAIKISDRDNTVEDGKTTRSNGG